VRVTTPQGETTVDVAPTTVVSVKAEKYDQLLLFNPKAWGGWQKGTPLRGLRAQECTSRGLLDPASLQLRAGPEATAQRFEFGKDYAAELDWGSIGRLPDGRIANGQPVYVDYQHALLRIDSVVRTAAGKIELLAGQPHVTNPLPPTLQQGDKVLANVFVSAGIKKLGPENLFPILETAYPEPAKPSPTVAEQRLPKTIAKLRSGQGIPYSALEMNAINHPNPRGMKLFADALMELFP
jgi:hypothetical protein